MRDKNSLYKTVWSSQLQKYFEDVTRVSIIPPISADSTRNMKLLFFGFFILFLFRLSIEIEISIFRSFCFQGAGVWLFGFIRIQCLRDECSSQQKNLSVSSPLFAIKFFFIFSEFLLARLIHTFFFFSGFLFIYFLFLWLRSVFGFLWYSIWS